MHARHACTPTKAGLGLKTPAGAVGHLLWTTASVDHSMARAAYAAAVGQSAWAMAGQGDDVFGRGRPFSCEDKLAAAGNVADQTRR